MKKNTLYRIAAELVQAESVKSCILMPISFFLKVFYLKTFSAPEFIELRS